MSRVHETNITGSGRGRPTSMLLPGLAEALRQTGGILAALCAIALLEFIPHTTYRITIPALVLQLVVVYAAFSGGLRTGLFAAALGWIYIIHYIAGPGAFFHVSHADLQLVVIAGASLPLTAVLVGLLNGRVGLVVREKTIRAQAEAAQRQFQGLVDGLGAIVWEMDPDTWRFTFVSHRAEELLGYSLQRWLHEPSFWQNLIYMEDRDRTLETCRTITTTGRDDDFEFRAVAADGRIVWLRGIVRAECSPEGRVSQLRGVMVDITQGREAEEALRESETRYRQMFERNQAVKLLIDPESGAIVDANPAACEFYGYDLETLRKKNVRDINRPPKAQSHNQPQADETGISRRESRHRLASGEIRDVEVETGPVDLRGRRLLYSIIHDITERNEAQEALRKSEERLNGILHSLDDIVWSLSAKTFEFLYISPAVETVTGYPPARFMEDPRFWSSLVHPEDRARFDASLPVFLENGASGFEYRIVCADGSVRWLNDRARLVHDAQGNGIRLDGIATDITQRKQAEEALRQSDVRLRAIADNVPVTLAVIDRNGVYTFISGKELESQGLEPGDFLGIPAAEIYRDEPEIMENVRRALAGEAFLSLDEMPATGRTFENRWVPLHDEDGEFAGTLVVSADITGRVTAEAALRESQQRLRTVIETAPIILFAIDASGHFTLCEGWGLESLGIRPEQIVGQSVFDLCRDLPEIVDAIEHALAGEAHTARFYLPEREKTYLTHYVPLRTPAGESNGVIGIGIDISDRVKLEAHLVAAQKMQTAGALAGGIAHDFNNMLQAILGYSAIMRARKTDDDPDSVCLDRIQQAGKRAAELTARLMTFGRLHPTSLRPVSLHALVDETCAALWQELPRSIRVTHALNAEPDWILGEPVQVQQALLNLLTNARDAMPSGGELNIATCNVVLDRSACRAWPGAEPGRYVELAVTDTGTGISPKILPRIFEPFFTTRKTGNGVGLGLAMVYGIMHSHEGFSAVESEPGKGARFSLFFRAADPCHEQEVAMSSEAPAGGTETLLIVDDEEMLVELLRRMLVRQGYTALVALSAQEGLRVYEENRDRIDLVITDLVMPGMDGKALAEELMRRDPHIRILVSTGFSAMSDIASLIEAGVRGVVMKPYQGEQLFANIRKALDQDPKDPDDPQVKEAPPNR